MIPIRTPEEVQSQFVEAVQDMLKRLEDVKEKFKDDTDRTRGHHMFSELSYWFHNNGQVNKKF